MRLRSWERELITRRRRRTSSSPSFVESSFSSLPSRYRLFTSIILWRRIYSADWLSFLCFFSQNTRRRSMGTSSKGELEVCFFRLSFQLPPLRHILSFTLMSPTDRLWIRHRELFYLPALLLFSRSSSSPLSLSSSTPLHLPRPLLPPLPGLPLTPMDPQSTRQEHQTRLL